MRARSRFTYGATTWDLTWPAKPWIPTDSTVGGSRVSAAGVPASYIVRRDTLLELTLRVEEAEWTDLLALIAFGQTGQEITWYPDQTDLGTSFQVYLESPAAGEPWSPARDSFDRHFAVTLTLRGASGSVPWQEYY